MARTHGKNSQFSFNAIALQDELNSITMTVTPPPADITAFADAYQNGVAGKRNIVTEIEGAWDAAAGAGDITLFEAIGAGPKSTIFDPTGSGPGANDPEYRCTASGLTGVLVGRYRMSFPVGEKASYGATLQHSGNTTREIA